MNQMQTTDTFSEYTEKARHYPPLIQITVRKILAEKHKLPIPLVTALKFPLIGKGRMKILQHIGIVKPSPAEFDPPRFCPICRRKLPRVIAYRLAETLNTPDNANF
jgi:hypothetical protein